MDIQRWIRRRPRQTTEYVEKQPWDLETSLMKLGEGDYWTIRHACQGLIALGSPGSGKTSSLRVLAALYARHRFGGLVMTVKPDERLAWIRIMQAAGREEDLIVVEADCKERFNFLAYEANRQSKGAGLTENITRLLHEVVSASQGGGYHEGSGENRYFERASDDLVRNTVDLIRIAGLPMSLETITDIISSGPTSAQQWDDPQWQDTSACAAAIKLAHQRRAGDIDENDYRVAERYWRHQFATLGERTRASITTTLTGAISPLQRGLLWRILGTDSTFRPEDTWERGKVVILDLNLQEFGAAGLLAQGIIKHVFQQAVLRRDTVAYPRPFFVWQDEAHNFLQGEDWRFLAEGRQARACVVMMTQSIAGIHAKLGKNTHATNALLTGLGTKVFFANGDTETNEWAANVVAKDWSWTEGNSINPGTDPSRGPMTASRTEGLHHQVPPVTFTRLTPGGPPHWTAEAIVFQAGRPFNGGQSVWTRAYFPQAH